MIDVVSKKRTRDEIDTDVNQRNRGPRDGDTVGISYPTGQCRTCSEGVIHTEGYQFSKVSLTGHFWKLPYQVIFENVSKQTQKRRSLCAAGLVL